MWILQNFKNTLFTEHLRATASIVWNYEPELSDKGGNDIFYLVQCVLDY